MLLGFVEQDQFASGRTFVAETALEFVLFSVGLLMSKFVLVGDKSLLAERASVHPIVGVRFHVKSIADFSF